MIIVVDTNIIFSALLNTQGTISDLMFNSADAFEFYSCAYMRTEIHRHWMKLLKISKLSDEQLQIAYDRLLTRLQFIDEAIIPRAFWIKAEKVVAGIDEDDIDFVALTTFLKGALWTGDKVLYNGLRTKRFKTVYNTSDLNALRAKLMP